MSVSTETSDCPVYLIEMSREAQADDQPTPSPQQYFSPCYESGRSDFSTLFNSLQADGKITLSAEHFLSSLSEDGLCKSYQASDKVLSADQNSSTLSLEDLSLSHPAPSTDSPTIRKDDVGSKAHQHHLFLNDIAIVFAGFIIQLFPQGLGNSNGVVYTYLKSLEQLTDYQISWIGSLMTGMMGIGAIIGACLIETVGPRLTSFVGGLLMTAGFVISGMTTNIYILYLSLGVMPGIGAALSQLAAVVCSARHFDKGRPLAAGVMATGGAVGMLTFPLLWSLCLETYGWRGAMLVFAGFSLNVIWSSWLLKPSTIPIEKDEVILTKNKMTFQTYIILLRRPDLIIFLMSAVFVGLSIFIYGSYVPEYAKDVLPEVTSTEIAILVCAMGAGSFIGRILFSSLSMTSPRAPLLLFVLALIMCGVSDVVVPFCRTYITLIFNSTCQGLFLGGWTTIVSLVTVNLFGADSLSCTLGMTFMFQGLGCVAGPPLASVLVGLTKNMDVLFYFAGCGYVVSVLFLFPLFKIKGHPYKKMATVIKAPKNEITGNTNLGFIEGGLT